jgi:hypothetical protein
MAFNISVSDKNSVPRSLAPGNDRPPLRDRRYGRIPEFTLFDLAGIKQPHAIGDTICIRRPKSYARAEVRGVCQ